MARDRLLLLRVADDDVGVGADRDRALPRIDVEDLRDVGRGDGDELVHGQPAGLDALGPQDRQPVLEPAGAVRDLAEVADAHPLLLGGEGAVVGRDHLQRARGEAGPERILVDLVAEGRRHHALRRIVPVRVEVFGLVERQVLDQRLAIDALAERPRPADRLVRRLAGDVDDVERHAGGVGDHDGAVGRLALDLGRPRIGVALRAGDAVRHVLVLEAGDDVAVLGMDERQGADLGRSAGTIWYSSSSFIISAPL